MKDMTYYGLIEVLALDSPYKTHEIHNYSVITGLEGIDLSRGIYNLIAIGITDLSQYLIAYKSMYKPKEIDTAPVTMQIPYDVADIIKSFLRAHKKKRMSYYKSNKVHDWVDKAGYFQVGIKSVTNTLDWAEC